MLRVVSIKVSAENRRQCVFASSFFSAKPFLKSIYRHHESFPFTSFCFVESVIEGKVFRFSFLLYHASVSNALYFKYTSSEIAKKKNETKLFPVASEKKKRKQKRKAIFH